MVLQKKVFLYKLYEKNFVSRVQSAGDIKAKKKG